MTDEQIEQMATEMFPFYEKKDYIRNNVTRMIQRESAIQAMKKVRDHYEQKLALIELTRTGDHADDQLAKQIGDLTDCELEKHCNKLSKKLK